VRVSRHWSGNQSPVAGQIDFSCLALRSVLSQMQGRTIKAIAIAEKAIMPSGQRPGPLPMKPA
jgi:hypothetical protein